MVVGLTEFVGLFPSEPFKCTHAHTYLLYTTRDKAENRKASRKIENHKRELREKSEALNALVEELFGLFLGMEANYMAADFTPFNIYFLKND